MMILGESYFPMTGTKNDLTLGSFRMLSTMV
jgi:hypothetical protein